MSSHYANQVEKLIKEAFPLLSYKKEEYVSYKGQKLYFDFILPDFSLYIEVQGQQHYTYIPFFHKAGEFRKQKYRDGLKKRWCGENKKILVSISYKEVGTLTKTSFRNKILSLVKKEL